MPGLQNLPTETLEVIAAYVAAERHDLVSLCHTASHISAVATRQLYRTVTIDARTKGCLFAVATNPALALHVRTFIFTGLEPSADAVDSTATGGDECAELLQLLGRALSNMRRVVTLCLSLGQGVAVSAATDMLLQSATEYPQLESFSCDFPLGDAMVEFLRHCPQIETLQLGGACAGPTPPAVPLFVAPRLQTLVASPDAVRALVPGRPVQAVHILSSHDSSGLDETTLAALRQSGMPLSVLDASLPTFDVATLWRVASVLGASLSVLRITVLGALTGEPDEDFLSPVADILDTLPELWSFELSGFHWSSHVQKNDHGSHRRAWQREPHRPQPLVTLDPITSETRVDAPEVHWMSEMDVLF